VLFERPVLTDRVGIAAKAATAICGARFVDIRSGQLQVRLARRMRIIDAAQACAYRIFYESWALRPGPKWPGGGATLIGLTATAITPRYRPHLGTGAGPIVAPTADPARAAARLGASTRLTNMTSRSLLRIPGEILETRALVA